MGVRYFKYVVRLPRQSGSEVCELVVKIKKENGIFPKSSLHNCERDVHLNKSDFEVIEDGEPFEMYCSYLVMYFNERHDSWFGGLHNCTSDFSNKEVQRVREVYFCALKCKIFDRDNNRLSMMSRLVGIDDTELSS